MGNLRQDAAASTPGALGLDCLTLGWCRIPDGAWSATQGAA